MEYIVIVKIGNTWTPQYNGRYHSNINDAFILMSKEAWNYPSYKFRVVDKNTNLKNYKE